MEMMANPLTEEERLRWAQIDPAYIRNNFPGVDPERDYKRCEVKISAVNPMALVWYKAL
jgi:hypothetical protein